MNLIKYVLSLFKLKRENIIFYICGSDTFPPPLTKEEEDDEKIPFLYDYFIGSIYFIFPDYHESEWTR